MTILELASKLEEMRIKHSNIKVLIEGEEITSVTFYPADPKEELEACINLEQ